jgi:hypothetical protein
MDKQVTLNKELQIDCFLCLWNNSDYYFDDNEYSKPLLNTKSYKLYKYTGYNHVINPNSFNPCYVCNNCLLFNIYCCDEELKYLLLLELKKHLIYLDVFKKNNIPNEICNKIISFL